MTYQDYINEIASLMPTLVVSPFAATAPFVNVNYNPVVPRSIEFVELMIYRDQDLDLLHALKADASGTLTAGDRDFTLTGNIIVVETMNVIIPTGDAPDVGTRVPLLRTSVDFINMVWPNEATTAAPTVGGTAYYAMQDDTTAIIAPTPDQNYTVEIYGNYRPTTLDYTNASSTSYLSTNYPDLYIAAAMIYWSGVMRNFGAQADDPRSSISWQSVYNMIKQGASLEQAKARSQGPSWAPVAPPIVANPPRS